MLIQLRQTWYSLKVIVCQADASTQIIDRLEITGSKGMLVEPNVELPPHDPYCNAKIKTA